MEKFDRKKHWETIYQTKELKDVSWYQPTPQTSLDLIKKFDVSITSKIIDIGGGDSFLVDHLLELGFQDLTILDISEAAIERAKIRLGSKAKSVKWLTEDVLNFIPTEKYDFWHDRAAFHFLTKQEEIDSYVEKATSFIQKNGILVIGTFSKQGPKKCSGIDIKQYSEESLSRCFEDAFQKLECIHIDHPTPFGTVQNFVFCSFRKL
jgi:2-polyprenyl-3-methyl-5-hydroxy-6-metoxy-1,4-benzoquinol methylase